jgi:sec-independent protein translocase protein TatB
VFGVSAQEFIVLLAVAAVVLGPERLPQYTQQLTRLVRELRRMAQGATEQVRAELGPEFDDVDWRKLDPRQYDPRRIVREALADAWDPDDPLGTGGTASDPLGLKTKPVSRGGPGETSGRTAGGTPDAPANGTARGGAEPTSPAGDGGGTTTAAAAPGPYGGKGSSAAPPAATATGGNGSASPEPAVPYDADAT